MDASTLIFLHGLSKSDANNIWEIVIQELTSRLQEVSFLFGGKPVGLCRLNLVTTRFPDTAAYIQKLEPRYWRRNTNELKGHLRWISPRVWETFELNQLKSAPSQLLLGFPKI
jgi:hypothetical protein